MKIEIPELSLIALVGASSSGKTTFANKYFKENYILSSDEFRRMVCDDENDQSISGKAFELLYKAAEIRLESGHRTVIDATNLKPADRKAVISLSKSQNLHAVAIVLNISEETLLKRNEERQDRKITSATIKRHSDLVKSSIKSLKKEGFRFVYVIDEEIVDEVEISYTKLWNDKRELHGPFDIIGDIHGCYDELVELLRKLGYEKNTASGFYRHPGGRTAVFVGDLTDRGPKNVETLKLVMDMVGSGNALCVPGNHDNKLERYLNGRNVQISHGLELTVKELDEQCGEFKKQVRDFLSGLISHYCLDDGRLVVSHAGIKQEYIGRASGRVREFCLYGDTTGETDDLGLPVRLDWAEDYRGESTIVYGHIPCGSVKQKNNTWCVDTGCVFGGSLTAFRYPEREVISVKAKKQYYKPIRPLEVEEKGLDGISILKAEDVVGRLRIETTCMGPVNINEDQSAAAFEVMSRFAAEPNWLIYLPPTMSPCETSTLDDYLEYPTQAFDYYAKNGVEQVVCEKKHMGSRSVIVLCHTEDAAKKRFKVNSGKKGIIYTRTGRSFFQDSDTESKILEKLDNALTESRFWQDFNTEWVIFDAEILPWSEKARTLLQTQYGPVGRAGRESLKMAIDLIDKAGFANSELDLLYLKERYKAKSDALDGYVKAYREYCWNVVTVDDIRIAPFHLLATELSVYDDKTNVWHMETIKKYCTGKVDMFVATDYTVVDLKDESSKKDGEDWWLSLTGAGGEGMVVKPMDFVVRKGKGILQPAVKCRGREYLRIIYGPEYLIDGHLGQLKKRSLSRKRSLALKEFALGLEGLHRFVEGDPLYRVHECAYGIQALESEPVDSRL